MTAGGGTSSAPERRAPDHSARAALVNARTAERAVRRLQRWWNFRGRFELADRNSGSDRLVTILAGHKRHLWPVTLERFRRFLPPDADVCLVTPGTRPAELEELARREGWSLLSTARNSTSLAQNLAVRAHPAARWILKLDEDIVIPEGLMEALIAAHERIEAEARHRPGFCAPVLNVNGYSYVEFLRTLGLEEEYRARFGALRHAAAGLPVTDDGEAARWVWERSLPFDAVAERFARREFSYSTVPHRFSIGAILYRREFWWEQMGGFRVRPPEGALGIDEAHVCRVCVDSSHAMTVAHNVLAGHVSFGPQDAVMRAALPALAAGMAPVPERAAARA